MAEQPGESPSNEIGCIDDMWSSQKKLSSAEEIGKRRQNLHMGFGTPRLNPDNPYDEDIIGVKGEKAWEYLTGCEMDTSDRIDGDMDDFTNLFIIDGCPQFYTIDVKTARKPYNLLVKVSEINKPVDIYVLARYTDVTDTIDFLGWQWRTVMAHQPIKTFILVPSYYMHASKLQDIKKLLDHIYTYTGQSWLGINLAR